MRWINILLKLYWRFVNIRQLPFADNNHVVLIYIFPYAIARMLTRAYLRRLGLHICRDHIGLLCFF